MTARLAPVLSMAAARARRREASPPPAPAHLSVRGGLVVLELSSRDELNLSPEHARTWAARLLVMAELAESGGDL